MIHVIVSDSQTRYTFQTKDVVLIEEPVVKWEDDRMVFDGGSVHLKGGFVLEGIESDSIAEVQQQIREDS